MSTLAIKSKLQCKWDALALGEVMLRLDPEFGRIRTARHFRIWEGGGEYNVVRALRKCFGKTTAVVTAIVDNEVGHLLEDLMLQGGVDLGHVKWVPFDGIGRNARVGLNFTEKGYGIRPAVGCSDRAWSAASQLKPGDIDWRAIFAEEGVRWLHCGGIFAALSATSSALTIEAMEAAKANGTVISYDLNFRASLWKSQGGTEKAIEINRRIAHLVDVMIGNEEDFTAALGMKVEGLDAQLNSLNPENFKTMIREAVEQFPNFKVVGTTLRTAKTANVNDWSAILYADGAFYQAQTRENLEIYDRVGGGDGFASGMIYALLEGKSPKDAVEYGAAHGALAMTTPGDTSMATLKEVEAAIKAKSARVIR
ncbi:MAG TPA: sugar kinase [Acidobacteriota bacterium]|nr:sugar kinase [Acidobacteriota bacterium]